ncbi:MAG TPA: COX15/CtaA family protein [Acidimicrobiales bacterium]|nr:COX15/CtaA family protein [Acidimicrobiales bacterium]
MSTPGFMRKSAATCMVGLGLGVVSGGAVRLTGSGLGCKDWPNCTATSLVAPLQYHAWVEFGNRLVNVVITLGVLGVALAALARRPRRRDLSWLAWGQVAGMFAEIVLGGETVLHKLAPPFVMAHFLLAAALVIDAAALFARSRKPDRLVSPGRAVPDRGRLLVRPGQRRAARVMLGWSCVVVALGTVVTSTGPHAGAPGVPRFHFSLHTVAQLHGTSVELLLALTVLTMWSLYRSRTEASVMRKAELVLLVMVAQAGVGYTQYLTGDPAALVAVHLAGATALLVSLDVFNMGLYAPPAPGSSDVGGASDPGVLAGLDAGEAPEHEAGTPALARL